MTLAPHRLAICLATALPLACLPARARDFTGVYIGVNAGYAFSRDGHERAGPVTLPDAVTSSRSETGLPPSALSASQSPAMRATASGRPQQR